MTELAPEGTYEPAVINAALVEAVQSPAVAAVTTRQQSTGLWANNYIAFEPNTRDKVEEPGTVAQYRRLVQLGVPITTRPFRLANRTLFRTLSRDDDPLLYGEFFDASLEDVDIGEWYRNLIREAASAALAEAGYAEDPRLRQSAHRVISAVSAFLRSPLAEDPLIKKGSGWQLHREAAPPSWWSIAMLAAMPALQRERAGFVDRLGQYLAAPAPTQNWHLVVGKNWIRNNHLVLGDPIQHEEGVAKDVPLALHTMELLASLGLFASSPSANAVWTRLLEDLDQSGVWHPRNLRSQPKAGSGITWHIWPLVADAGEVTSRQADMTFRIAMIARRLGLTLEYS